MAPSFLGSYLPYLLQRTDHLVSRRFHRSLRRRGVQVSEWRVLAVLHDGGPMTVSALTRLSLLPQPTTTHAIARLERAAHVARRSGERDGRQRIVALTASGQHLAADLVEQAGVELDATLSAHGIAPPPELVAQLARLIDALERDTAAD